MDIDADTSRRSYLYQVPLQEADVRVYKKPVTQVAVNPQNCVAAASRLLGLIPKSLTEKLSREGVAPITGDRIRARVNKYVEEERKKYYPISFKLTAALIDKFRISLFSHFATIVMSNSATRGHAFVIAKTEDGEIRSLEPQPGFCSGTTTEEILEMIRYPYREEVGSEITITVFLSMVPRSYDEFGSEYIEGPLSALFARAKFGGSRVSLPRRSAGRSSSSRKKRRTRRRSALPRQTAGYQPRG